MTYSRFSNRRQFLRGVGATGAATVAASALRIHPLLGSGTASANSEEDPGSDRRQQAFEIRKGAALAERRIPVPEQRTNGDEQAYPNKIGNFSKGLPHNDIGEVDLAAYATLTDALASEDPAMFEQITLGAPPADRRRLVNPQAGLAFDLQGTDSHQLTIPPAPAFSSADEAAEIVEDYWMALLRDVPFSEYDSNPTARAAAAELSNLPGFSGPRDASGRVTGNTLFRGSTPGDVAGPYLSQFLLLPVPFGSESVSSRQQTYVPGLDYMTNFPEWLTVQRGFQRGSNQFDSTRRYIRNGRDLSAFVHVDALFQAYFLAFLILNQIQAPLNRGNPYNNSLTQDGFGTFGVPHAQTLCTEVCSRALRAVWFQKWFVHRRLRPDEFAARLHNVKIGVADYPIHADALRSNAAREVHRRHGSYLLPMAFPEGAPFHPAYGAGHATVAGACVTMLKALFDGSAKIGDLLRAGDTGYTTPVVPSSDGESLVPYTGDDAGDLTVEGELNKVASNIGLGRDHAGVHWRSDHAQSIYLGEQVAISILRDQGGCYNEAFQGFTFTKFDGTVVTI